MTALWANGFVSDDQYKNVFLTWLTGDAVGVLILTPLLLSLIYAHRKLVNLVEVSLYFVLLTVISLYALGILAESPNNTLLFALMPFTLWAVFRFDQRFVFASILIISVNGIATMTFNVGWLSLIEENARLTELQQFVSIFSISVILLSILKAAADDAEAKLRDANNTLDIEVKKCTFELEQSNLQLQRREAQYSSLFENMLNGVALHKVILDQDGEPVDLEYVAVNPVFEVHSGLKRNEVIGKRVTEVIPEMNKGELDLIKKYGEVALTGNSNKFEFYFPPLDKWFLVYAYSPIANHVATVSEDITESKEAAESLKNQELFISALADTSPAIFYVYDLESNSNVYVNSGIERLLGFSAKEIQDMGASVLTNLVRPDDFSEVVATHSKISSALDEDCFDIEYRVKHKDGTWRYLHNNERIFLRKKDGSVKQKIGIAFDITDRKQVEESLRESEKLLREAHRTAHIAHWTFNPATGMSWWSEELYRIYGLNPSDGPLSYAEHPKLVHPDDWEWVDATVRDTAENGTPFDIILRIMRPDGSERVLNAICQPVKDDTGAVIEMRGTIQDITKIKQAEVQLKESDRRYRTLVDNLSGMVYRSECTPNFSMQFVSDGCEAICGYTSSELTGEHPIDLRDVVHPSDQKRILETTQLAVSQNQPFEYEYRIRTKDGSERWVWEQGRSISMGDGGPVFLEGYITEGANRNKWF